MKYFYSLYTGEHVQSDVKASWMGETKTPPPGVEDGESAFFEDGVWVVRGAEPEMMSEAEIKEQAVRLLFESDYKTIKAIERGEEVPQEWAAYRQTLRDIYNDPSIVAEEGWPSAPQS